jgi:formylglycine-generating enzyme required for sulfatase activity
MRSTFLYSVALALFFAAYQSPDTMPSTAFHPGQVFRDCPDCPEMVVIPAGSFLMGTPANEPGRDEIEGPQRRVTIAQFSAGKFDIKLAQWKAFVKDTNRKTVGGCTWAPFESRFESRRLVGEAGLPTG